MNTTEQIQDVIETVSSALAPSKLSKAGRPNFSFNGLATPPLRPESKFFGLFCIIDVPPGTWGVCHGSNGTPPILPTGTHWLSGEQKNISAVQFVDATQRRHNLAPTSGLTSDGWRVTFEANLVYEVTDPAQAARSADVITTLEAAGRAALLAQIEAMTHRALIGSLFNDPDFEPGSADPAGLKQIEDGILARLEQRPSLAGLRVIEVAIVERMGDERLVEIIRSAEIERTEVIEERQTETERAELARVRLEAEAQTFSAARASAMAEAETRAQLAAVEEQLKLLAARTEADIQEIEQIQGARENERKRMIEEWRTAKELDLRAMEYQHAQTLAIIDGTTQVTTAAARSGAYDGTSGAPWAAQTGVKVVGDGLQVLKGYREQIAPPITRFLPQPEAISSKPEEPDRLRVEALRLSRVRRAEHELIIRHGQLATARIWFAENAPNGLAGIEFQFSCPEEYPLACPILHVARNDQVSEQPVLDWNPELYLADVVRDLMLDIMHGEAAGEEE